MMGKWRKALEERFPIGQFLHKHLLSYQVPANLNVWYVFGLLAMVMVANQFISGLWLVMFYIPTVKEAFSSVQSLMQDVPAGWFIRYLHTTGASFLFMVMILHIVRGFLYGSYHKPREFVWFLGICLWIFMIIEAFMGYVLPWGQMSYWGAEVVTSVFNAIPVVGEGLKEWIRGGQEVGQPLLQRFFALHIIALPFLLFILIKIHVIAIRCVGSSNPEEDTGQKLRKIPFVPDYMIRELFPLSLFVMLFFFIVFFWPNVGGLFIESDNLQMANPFQTPASIHPPWYITPYFAILRAIPHLGCGLFVTMLSILIWFGLPFLDKSQMRTLKKKSALFKAAVMIFGINYVCLSILGWWEINDITLWCARLGVLIYFLFFITMPWYSRQSTLI
ncbi:MAG: cytochrome bc complex cytochrome b subunit [Gammaproteobacteria bacterium]|nr:cytochrome bc complex cytochrome b subunit [Gammaproteobacteria bacterium]